jgi:lytic murein transglycosylase
MRTKLMFGLGLILGVLSLSPATAAESCRQTVSFEHWLEQFKKDARAQGISPRVIAEASPDLRYDPVIVKRDGAQGVFQQSFLQFSDRMVGGARIPNGQKKMQQYAAVFRAVEQKYGVPAPVLTAFWGLESDYGANFGNYKILTALTTLAYDCRRADFFRQQLTDALRLIENGDQRPEDMVGYWGGEFGGMQFTASDYFKYGVDFDGDGRRDIIRSIPDTLGTAANFLVHLGWKRGEPWLQEVRVPREMPWEEADPYVKHPVSQWEKWGVRGAHGPLPNGTLQASLILPMGRNGPAFLAYPNFQVFLGWNSAYVYSTTVAYFATRLAGAPVVDHAGAKEVEVLPTEQIKEIQVLLNQHGFGAGDADGRVGSGTRMAIKKAQLKFGLPADSYPTAELLARLKAGEATARDTPRPKPQHRTYRR